MFYSFILFALSSLGLYDGVYRERPVTPENKQDHVVASPPTKRNKDMIRIVCVGDSITKGYLRRDEPDEVYTNETWPFRLAGMINNHDKYEVLTFAHGGKCAQKNRDCSFWDTDEYYQAVQSKPDIVTLMFGTNDAYMSYWDEKQYRDDYTDMVKTF